MLRQFFAFILALFVSLSVHGQTRIQGAGATFPNPLYQKWVITYSRENPSVSIDYQSIGSGGGIKGIIDKTLDFAGSDAPLTRKEKAAAPSEVLHLPMVAGAVVPAYNLPGLSGQLNLSGDVLADIYLGKITTWNDAKIAADNPGLILPALRIVPVYRTDGSGTTFVFTNYLATQSDAFKETIGMGKAVQWPQGQGGKGNEGVTAAVQQTPGALGYVEMNYASANNIPFAAVKNQAGRFIHASPESVSQASDAAAAGMKQDLAVDLWNQPGDGAYPIASFTYILIYKDLNYLRDESKARQLVDFLRWSATKGQPMASELLYAPLAPTVQSRVLEAIDSLTFDGKPLK